MIATIIVSSWSLLILSTVAVILKPNCLTWFAFLGFFICAFWSMALVY